jgi:hypothetical protein
VRRLPELIERAREFTATAQRLQEVHALNKKMLEQQVPLLELLQLPRLMDQCVRNELFEEALELEQYARSLLERNPKVALLHELVGEMAGSVETVHHRLLELLQGRLDLPTCMTVVRLLRRIARLDAHSLRAQFLHRRSAWFESEMRAQTAGRGAGAHVQPSQAEAMRAAPYEFVMRLLQCHRESLLSIIAQYRACFPEGEGYGDGDGDGDGDGHAKAADDGNGLLYFWVSHRTAILVRAIRDVVALLRDCLMLSTVLRECLSLGASLARAGVDFRGLLPSVFEERVLAIVEGHLAPAPAEFADALARRPWVMDAAALARSALPTDNPLLAHPPVAILANRFIAALNELRHCALLTLRARVAAAMERTLLDAAAKLLAAVAASAAAGNDTHVAASALARCFSQHLVAFVSGALRNVFNAKDVLNPAQIHAQLAPLLE